MGNFEEGRIYCEKSLQTAAQIGDFLNLAVCEWHYGYICLFKGDLKLAIEHHQKAIGYSEKPKLWFFMLAVSTLGYAYYLLGDLETARKHAEKALGLQRDAGIEVFSSIAYWVLSLIHLDIGKVRNAQSCIEEALELSQKNNERAYEGLSWISLGRILGKMDPSQSDKAVDCILHGIKILVELKTKPYYSQGYLFLGEIYTATGQSEKALENLKKAMEMFQEMRMDYWQTRTKEVLDRL